MLFGSKIAAKVLCAAGLVKSAPFIVPIACAAVCVGTTIAGAKYLSKKLSAKEAVNVALLPCAYSDDDYDYADEDSISDDADLNDEYNDKDNDKVE